jgi:SAM-dependent methyltransferase
MLRDGYTFMVDSVPKFFNTVRVYGWFHHPRDTLSSVELLDDGVVASLNAVGLEYPGVSSLGPNKGFSSQVLRQTEGLGEQARLRFSTRRGWVCEVDLAELMRERLALYPSPAIMHRFMAAVEAMGRARVLDVGGRARSGLDRSQFFPGSEYVVFDVLPGGNVDVVGDAHELTRHFPPEHFDAILSCAVFEHLMMPWTVVTEMNRVLKPGGLVFVATHQTLGMHDLPWDFWRFSDTAWDALFNARTGFEIVERALDGEQYIVPFIVTAAKLHAEKSAGFEGSVVLARKTGQCTMSWPLRAADIVGTTYPAQVDDTGTTHG